MRRAKLQSTVERLMNWVLVVGGTLAAVISIADLVFDLEESILFKAFPSITLLLVALMATGLGLERLITYERLEKTIEAGAGGIRLDSWDEIYAAASELVKSARMQVRATAFGGGEWAGPDTYLDVVARTAQSRHENRENFLYKVVFGYQAEADLDRIRHILHRAEIFQKHGVSQALQMRLADSVWGLDLLIVDDKHLIIAFQQIQAQFLRVGMKFVDQPGLVEAVAEWYDERVWGGASALDLAELRKIVENRA